MERKRISKRGHRGGGGGTKEIILVRWTMFILHFDFETNKDK